MSELLLLVGAVVVVAVGGLIALGAATLRGLLNYWRRWA